MKKHLLFLFAAFATLFTSAQTKVEIDGIWYNLISEDNVAEVTSGTKYSGSITIPATVTYESVSYSVTSIEEDAFYYCSSLTSITIPESVTSIGIYAFGECSSLTYITIPENSQLTSIGNKAFIDCSSLTTVTISENSKLTSIGRGAFENCSSLTAITIPESVTNIGNFAFYNCSSLTTVTISENSKLTSIGSGAFSGCSGFTSITIPEGVTSIGSYAFSGCTGELVVNCNIPSKTSYDEGAFYNSEFTKVTIGESVTSIGNYAFYDCGGLTSITIPEGVTTIGGYAFYGCSKLTAINIPQGVTSIGNYAFGDCSSPTSITIPESVTSIGNYAFNGCSSIKEVTFGKGLKKIGSSSFSGCESIEKIIIHATQPPMADGFIFSDATYENATLYVPQDCVSKYQVMTGWSGFYNILVNELVTKITLSQQKATMIEGTTLLLTATVTPNYAADRSITWNSSDETIATVDGEGKVTAVTPGIVTITATANDGSEVSASCEITVQARRSSIAIVDPYSEDCFTQYVAEEDVNITYTRTFNNTNWQALYVPFEIPVTAELLADFEVAKLNDVRQYDRNDDGEKDETVIESFKVTKGTLRANYPYLIRAKEVGKKTITVTDATLHPTEENSIDCSSICEKFTFTGTYSRLSSDELPQGQGYYALSGGVWQPVAENASLGVFRFYLKVESRDGLNSGSSNAIRMRIIDEDEATEINELEASDNSQQPAVVYDLQGRRISDVSNLKGIYIVNGKKVAF